MRVVVSRLGVEGDEGEVLAEEGACSGLPDWRNRVRGCHLEDEGGATMPEKLVTDAEVGTPPGRLPDSAGSIAASCPAERLRPVQWRNFQYL